MRLIFLKTLVIQEIDYKTESPFWDKEQSFTEDEMSLEPDFPDQKGDLF